MSAPANPPPAGSPHDWLRHAASDLHLAGIALPDPEVMRNQIAFHAQQAAEKSLKALLVARQIHFPRTHDLEALIEMIRMAGLTWPFAAAEIEALTPFAVETRYPGGFAQVTDAEANESVQTARRVLAWARVVIQSDPLKMRAVFLDRDGVINRALTRDHKPYPPTSLAEFEILPGVAEACRQLKQAGFLLVVATNQPDVGRGTMAQSTVEDLHAHMGRELPLDRVEVCYHPGQGKSDCDCRKPKPGMLLRAAQALNIDLAASWMVGDRWRDVDCGHAAGCRTVFIDCGYDEALKQPPDFRVRDLSEAARIILNAPAP